MQTTSYSRHSRAGLTVLVFVAAVVGCGGTKKVVRKQDPGLYYRRGVELLHQQRPDLALLEFDKAATIDSGSSLIQYGLGLAHLGLQDFVAARGRFERVLELDPYFTDARNNLGIVYGELGETERAIREFKHVLADKRYLTPEVAQYNIGALLCDQSRFDESVVFLDAAILRKPDNPGWRVQRGRALQELGHHELALADFARAAELSPTLAEAHFYAGVSHIALKQFGEARESLLRAPQAAPASSIASRAQELLKTLPAAAPKR